MSYSIILTNDNDGEIKDPVIDIILGYENSEQDGMMISLSTETALYNLELDKKDLQEVLKDLHDDYYIVVGTLLCDPCLNVSRQELSSIMRSTFEEIYNKLAERKLNFPYFLNFDSYMKSELTDVIKNKSYSIKEAQDICELELKFKSNIVIKLKLPLEYYHDSRNKKQKTT